MKLLVDMSDVDNLIISAIEETPLDLDNGSGEQSELWMKIYAALNQLRNQAVSLEAAAKKAGYYLKNVDDAYHAGE